MVLTTKIGDSTGRAKCMMCRKKIEKGLKQLWISGYKTEGNIHNHPKDCEGR